jgi:hypothetical protein
MVRFIIYICQLMNFWLIILWYSVPVCSDSNTLCVTVLLCTLNVHNKLPLNTFCNSSHPVLSISPIQKHKRSSRYIITTFHSVCHQTHTTFQHYLSVTFYSPTIQSFGSSWDPNNFQLTVTLSFTPVIVWVTGVNLIKPRTLLVWLKGEEAASV